MYTILDKFISFTRKYPTMFGKSYLLDAYGVSSDKCNDLELVYRYLEELVDKINMNLAGSIIVIHGPRKLGQEIYPSKEGITGIAPLIESAIVIHTLAKTGFISLDVYSCGLFNPKDVFDFTQQIFQFSDYEEHLINRGIKYICVE